MELIGDEMSVDEIMKRVLTDKCFYENSDSGGITLSGGEPMAQFGELLELVKAAKKENLHVCLDTCGHAPYRQFEEIVPYIDIFLYDIKTINSEKHKELTGVGNELILENLRKLDSEHNAKIILRCPLVPGVNDSDECLKEIGKLADTLRNVTAIEIEPYHPLGENKSLRLGTTPNITGGFVPTELIQHYIETIRCETKIPVIKA